MLKALFFDLDGTLTDSQQGIVNSIKYSLHKLQLPELDAATLKLFIGPPLLASYQKYSGLSAADAQLALTAYREYYTDKGIFENKVYPGIPAALTQLQQNYRLYITTSKPELYAQQISDHFALSSYFTGIYGASMDESRAGKSEIIAYAQSETGLTQGQNLVMVGDRENDINGAHDHGLNSIAVTYGFGAQSELSAAAPSAFAALPTDLPQVVAQLDR
ncbi:HAD-IA family hydrolase [Loigolactobacillus coryniformis]|jgi:phosphoglycolate phosphatase|uniref:Haloacid dehalogenase n=1 Tax=Loigolactobacillus coryniformis subsp. torquens DSM 20004 = KCTC 3535 TaxID=1423822 RepID=A0A2D1KQX0_9LACO|nr:HAD-IA family hydrolase [Loigolactobacillus coryniformis]ATO44534.1 haloacid dehalogenase [Loigolactobacillus coryniformis subsp. torquens DSM 20004 = KCTC 3535]KRK84990.1 5-nucleotidase [Loigolactobacillus coryniformis subsp. torquens DSM 20004 = KCTC 3535]MBW4803277.1 HAD-IA family hydrolase [Loigolactobacillus coryniformis subsp. torquens]MBW4805973.1 HAD-IA family hydrolase [Loigolactobacillus coryniformis subsp. torquens]MCL5458017.1 HAD-IA family hydrolase [Loigolactobacillus corynifo